MLGNGHKDLNTSYNVLGRLTRGSILVMIGFVLFNISYFIFRVLIARSLTVSEYGIVSFLDSVVNVASIVATAGLLSSLPKILAEYRVKNSDTAGIVGNALLITFVFALIISVTTIIMMSSLVDRYFVVYLLFVISIPFIAVTLVITAVGRGFEDVIPKAVIRDILLGLLLIVTSVVTYITRSVVNTSICYAVSSFIVFIAAVTYLVKNYRITITTEHTKFLISFSLVFLFIAFGYRLLTLSDNIMLGILLGNEAVGTYAAPQTIGRIASIFHNIVQFLFYPIIVSLVVSGNIGEAGKLYKIVTKWVIVFSIPLAVLTVLFSKDIISFVFGDKYVESYIVLPILLLGFLVHSAFGSNGPTLVAFDEHKKILLYSSIASLFNILLNLILIPRYGIIGAAIATTVSLMLMNVLISYRLYRVSGIHPFYRKLTVPVIATFVSLIPVLLITNRILGALMFVVMYSGLIILLDIFDKDDKILFCRAIRKLGGSTCKNLHT